MSQTLKFHRGDLIKSAPAGLIVHCCNCQGKWGAGFAKQLQDADPEAFGLYQLQCRFPPPKGLLGTAMVVAGKKFTVANLMVSRSYGAFKDAPDVILDNIELALKDLAAKAQAFKVSGHLQLNSPLMGTGLFNVPWTSVEVKINKFLNDNPDARWTVWKLS